MLIQAIVIFACTATPIKAPPEQTDEAPGHQNLELNLDECMREIVQIQNQANPNATVDFTGPGWMKAAAQVGAEWEAKHPGWYIYRMKGPDQNNKLPEGCPITIKCPYEGHSI